MYPVLHRTTKRTGTHAIQAPTKREPGGTRALLGGLMVGANGAGTNGAGRLSPRSPMRNAL